MATHAPVDSSTQARAARYPSALVTPNATAARWLSARPSISASSVSVPGVISRTTSRRTTPLAAAGSSICSHRATRWPAAIIFRRYPSTAWNGTPAIGISSGLPLFRLVSATPSTREQTRASSQNIS